MNRLKVILFLLISIPASAQFTFGDPLTGRPYKFDKYSGIRGTPFLFDDWVPGYAFTSTKIGYKDVQLKLDISDNVLFFKFKNEPYEFHDNIAKFTLMLNPADSSTFLSFRRGYSGDGLEPDRYAQILADGQLTLLKVETKQISELNEINSGVVKSFTLITKYFVFKKDGKILSVRLNKNDMTAILESNEQVLEYVKQHELSFKKEKDVVAAIKYYNSLPALR